MAYQGSGYFGGIRFNNPATAAAYQKGEGYYTTMPGINPNQPGWGNLVPAGYELVGYKAPKMSGNFRSTNRAPIPGTSFAVLKKQMPAPAPAPAAPDPASPSPQQLQITAEAQKYREESEAKLADAQKLLDDFKIEQNKAAEAKKLQEQMAIRAQGTLASNLAMSQRQPSLQLSPASQTPQTAGTQPFKRRRLQVMTPGSQVTSGLNIGSANLLNV